LSAAGNTVVDFRLNQGIEVEVKITNPSTLTEEPCMTGSSEKALVERRYSAGDDLRLGSSQAFVMLIVRDHYMLQRQVLNFL